MVRKKRVIAKSTTRQATSTYRKALDNEKLRMPTEVESIIRDRQKDSVEQYKATSALLQARCELPQERRKREQVLIRIAKKLGIYDELLELKSIDLERKKRWHEALSKHDLAKLG